MAKLHRLWRFMPARDELVGKLMDTLGVSKAVAQILINRGVLDEHSARDFLYAGSDKLGDPFLLKGMLKAVERISHALAKGEKITVYGDYDVDGITATTLMIKVLKRLGANAEYYIPERQSEGYGLNSAALVSLCEEGTQLLVTVDCGISAVHEVNELAGKLDIIITDHHQPPSELPEACAIVNPKQSDCSYPDKTLAGVGVAFKLCQALWQHLRCDGILLDYLDIVAIGTIADIVPLTEENRILVRLGMEQLASTENVGLKALMEVCNVANKIDAGKVGFVLAPRLNAAGRLGHAGVGVELLLTDDKERAAELSALLDAENLQRQAVEREILAAAEEMLSNVDIAGQKVLVVAGDNWHPGVIGIVASRLVDKYYRPVVMISVRDGIGKGSCRSIPGFDIYESLKKCADILIQFGGHRQAAGLSIAAENIDILRDRLSHIAAETLTDQDYIPVLKIDSLIALDEIDSALLEELASLNPYGMGNPSPVFACQELLLANIRPVGQDGRHLKLRVKSAATSGDVIGWDMGNMADNLNCQESIDLAFMPEFNEWQGRRLIQLRAHDVRKTVKVLSLVDELFAANLSDNKYRSITACDKFMSKVVGVTFGERQQCVQRLLPGQNLILKRERDNSHDPYAIKVEREDGQEVGYLKASLAHELATVIDAGQCYRCIVTAVTGGGENHYGVNIMISRIDEIPVNETLERQDGVSDAEFVRSMILGDRQYHTSQLSVLTQLASGNNTLAIMGTGRGKSAIFQSHAALVSLQSQKMSIIVYPLRALVNDQFLNISRFARNLGLRIFKGNGTLSAEERAVLFDAIRNHKVDILLATPEFIEAHIELFSQANDYVGFFVVDECHHIYHSGKRQRPVYQRLGNIICKLGSPTVLGVTATADDNTATNICQTLSVEKVVIDKTVRSNLQIRDARRCKDKLGYLADILDQGGKTLIYVNSRKQAFELAQKLREHIPELAEQIGFYHAGLANDWRVQVEDWFRDSTLQVVVATSAFGEGIDLPDIRHVILYHLPFNMTAFNQQCGRAGRDGNESIIHLLFGSEDVELNHLILSNTSPDRETIGRVYLTLKSEGNAKDGVVLTNTQIAECVWEKYRIKINENGAGTSLKILEELNLLERETHGSKRTIFLTPAPATKLDIEQSLTYREGLLEKEAFSLFAQDVMSAKAEDLLCYINRPVHPITIDDKEAN